MRAFVIEELGKPGSVQEVPDPTPEAGEVLVRVRAAGVDPFDAAVVNGYVAGMMEHRFPLIPGGELSGQVVQGPERSGWTEGAEVYGAVSKPFLGAGSWAEAATTPATDVAPKPASLSHGEASGVTIAGLTALQAVDEAGLGEGDVLVIVGATGGVGSYAVQLAAARGIEVVAVTRGENAEYARSLGAARTIDYTKGDVVEQVHAASPDGVAGLLDTFHDAEGVSGLAAIVRSGGVVVSPKRGADDEVLGARGLRGVNVNRAPLSRLKEMNELFEKGTIRPPETKAYPLEEANEAVDEVGGGHVRGKLAIRIG